MTRIQYEIIRKLISTGAPVLAAELCGALDNLIQAYNATNEELKALKESQVVEPEKKTLDNI